jgi:hypothetical protein
MSGYYTPILATGNYQSSRGVSIFESLASRLKKKVGKRGDFSFLDVLRSVPSAAEAGAATG